MYRFHIRCLLTVAVCLLVISLFYFIVCQATFSAVCIGLTLTTLFISYIYQSNNGIHVQVTPHLSSFPADGNLGVLHSSGTATVTTLPGAIPNDKTQPFNYSSRPNSNGIAGLCGELRPCKITDHNAVPNRRIQQQIPAQSSVYIPVQTSKSEQLSNRSLAEGNTTANVYLGGDFPSQSVGDDGQFNNANISPASPLPRFRRLPGSDNAAPELSSHADQVSRNAANEVATHPTHQLQFGSLGILPLVHLPAAPHAFSNVGSSRSLSHDPVTVKIAPPDPLVTPLQFVRPENESPPSHGSKCSLNNVLIALTEKRKRNTQRDETLETGTGFYQQSNKRRKLDYGVESASSSSPPVVTSCSGGMSLKRPALRDICEESDSSKHRRLQPSSAVPSSASQPGATSRNPVDASYSSSDRWLKHKANVDLKMASNICQDTSQSPSVETEARTTVVYRSTKIEIVQKSFSESEVMICGEEEHRLPSSPCESSMTIAQPSNSRNSLSYASLDKGHPDDNSSLNNLKLPKKDHPLYKANLPMSSLGELQEYPVQSAIYKAQLTIEDVERDRQKEMERVKYMLGEASDLVQDAEPGQPVPCAVSSAPTTLSLPQAATSGLPPTSGAPSVSGSLSSDAEHMPFSTTAPSVLQQTSANATVVYTAPSLTDSTVSCPDLPSSIACSSFHSQVLSAASSNSPVSLNAESMTCQASDSTSTASVTLTSPEITTFASPTSGLYGGFKFDKLASKEASLPGFSANSSSVSNTFGGFKFEPSKKSLPAIGSFKSSQCMTAGEKISEIAPTETGGFHFPAFTNSSAVSASTNLAAAFGFGQTTSKPALSLIQPQTSTSTASVTIADDSLVKSATSVSAVQVGPVFSFVTQSVGTASKLALDQSLAVNKMSSSDFLNNVSRNEALGGFEKPSSTKTIFSGTFGSSVTNSSASNSGTLNSTTTSVNPTAFENPGTGMFLNSRGFLPKVDEKNQSLVTAFGSQQALVSNSVFASQLKSPSNAGNQSMPGQSFGACTTSGITLGAQPASGIMFGSQSSLPFSFGSQPVVTNSFGSGVTTASLFGNQSTPVSSVLSTPVASLNSLGNSNTSLFSFTSPPSVNLPSNSEASVFSFNSPASVKSLGISQASLFPINNPTSVNSLSSPEISLNLSGTGQFTNQANNSASSFGGLPLSNSNIFGNPEQTSLNNPFGKQQIVSFNFSTTTTENAFGKQNTSMLSFGNHSAVTSMFGNRVGDQNTRTGGFASSLGLLSAPSCVVQPTAVFSSPIFSQSQFQFPSAHAGAPNYSSGLNTAFQFPQNPVTTSTLASTQTTDAPSAFSFGQSSVPPFNFAPNPALGFQQLPNNSPTTQPGQFPSQLNPFSPPQPQFTPQLPWTPKFSIGTDNSNSSKNRSSIKNRLRKKT